MSNSRQSPYPVFFKLWVPLALWFSELLSYSPQIITYKIDRTNVLYAKYYPNPVGHFGKIVSNVQYLPLWKVVATKTQNDTVVIMKGCKYFFLYNVWIMRETGFDLKQWVVKQFCLRMRNQVTVIVVHTITPYKILSLINPVSLTSHIYIYVNSLVREPVDVQLTFKYCFACFWVFKVSTKKIVC